MRKNSVLNAVVLFVACGLVLLAAVFAHQHVEAQVIGFDTGQVSCGSSATVLVAANPQRTGLLITNVGSTTAVYE